MNLEDRVLFLEMLTKAMIWGPYLKDKKHRKEIADHLYTCAEASQRHQTHPQTVQQALLQFANSLAEIDNTPDALRPALKPSGSSQRRAKK